MEIYNLYKLITKVMENDGEVLEGLHRQFNPLLTKYATLFHVDKNELLCEFDLILINIYKKEIKDDFKILKYIKTVFKNYRKFQETSLINIFDIQNAKNEVDILSDIFFDDLIESFNEETKKLFNLKFKKQYTYSELAQEYGVTRQYIHKKIKLSLNLLKDII